FVPSRPDGATLAAELPLPAGEVVLARSDRAARDLPEILRRRGARVRELEAYRTVPGVGGDVAAARASLAGGDAVVLFASPSAVEGMLDGLPLELVRRAAIVAIGPSTAAAVRQRLGVEPLVARGTGTSEIARAVRGAARGGVPA
ncbi:MAG: uroporphyrinogen-III synthase, partial [Candidatus Limnocylindria bacterium]